MSIPRIVTADARKVSGAEFLEGFLGPYEPKRRAIYERCIRLIEVGHDMYGYPPAMVEECRKIIAERDAEPLSELKRTGTDGGSYWL